MTAGGVMIDCNPNNVGVIIGIKTNLVILTDLHNLVCVSFQSSSTPSKYDANFIKTSLFIVGNNLT